MKPDALPGAEKYAKAHRREKRWYRVVTCLAAVVVFCTTYALILPAITLEKKCEIPEHTHTDACYTQVTTREKRNLICTVKADTVIHHHDSACYDENGNLWCPLPEIEAHAHTESCYAVPEADAPEVHTHADDCYTMERSELTCTEHVHTDGCYRETSTLICGLEEGDGHQHGESCQNEAGEIVCGIEASEGHHHDGGCYEAHRERICGVDSDHQHTDQCYAQSKTLNCDLSTEPVEAAEPAEPVLVCEEPEVILHTHQPYEDEENPGCYAADGKTLVCGKPQVVEHQHTDACFETVEEPVDTESLTCTLPEDETHTHGPLCYGTWELSCGMEEHTHSEKCTPTQESVEESTAETAPETSTWTVPSGLPVMGTADATSVMPLDAGTTQSTGPISAGSYITGATLYFRTDENPAWTNVSGATDIPGNANFKLEIRYGNVPIEALQAADGKMTYTLPALFRNATANVQITSDSKTVGTITVEGDTVTLAFDRTWLAQQKTDNNTVISGDFFVEAEVNLSQVGEDGKGQIVIGNTTIPITFDGDIVAKYGKVNLTKTVSKKTDGDYLTYTLTVKAGADGCPDVKVVDRFAETQYIEEYVGVTGVSTATNDTDGPTETGGNGSVYIGAAPTVENPIPGPAGENPTKPGTLVWDIGAMNANETRTLTYRVKLKDAYTGVTAKGNLQNTANVYSKTYQRDSDTVTFTPKAKATMSKVASEFTPGENGGGTITYTIWVHADKDNSYVLDNVKIKDALDGSIENMNPTLPNIRQYLSYVENSFHLYQGGSNRQNGSSGLTEITTGTTLTITDKDNDGKNNDSFTYYVGSLAPGESKTLTYTVNVEPGVFMAAGNKDVQINNRACIYTVDGKKLNGYNTPPWTINRKVWSRKLAGGKLETDSKVSMSGSVYDATGGSVTQITSPDSSFTVPAGSYRYQVVANEAGDWDLSSAYMADSLGSQYMQFVGYVRVDAYTIDSNAPDSSLGDADVIANLRGRTPDQTVWVKVDGKTSFTFTPVQIGLMNEPQAYLLTYYAQPTNTHGITQVAVSNRFNLSGRMGIGDIYYELTDIVIGAEASVVVEGSKSFTAEKQSWYYEEAPKVTTGDFANGALYWVIKVDGNVLPPRTAIKDVTNAADGSTHYIQGNSFVGVYTGNLGTGSLADYADLGSLIASNRLTALESSNYTVAKDDNSLTLTLKTDIHLAQGDSLYLIVKTEPKDLPANKRDAFTYNNKLQSSSDGTNWVDHNVASKTLYGSKNIFKELGKTFIFDGDSRTDAIVDKGGAVIQENLHGPGYYAAWAVKVNYEGDLSGRYRVVDFIPEGMELAYARIKWRGQGVRRGTGAQMVQISNLGDGWTEHTMTAAMDGEGKMTSYYYTSADGRQVCWEVDNLFAGKQRDTYSVDFQVVCRVTDPDVLLGGVSKAFNNVVSLQNSEGTTIGNDSNGVTIEKEQTLFKEGTYDPATNGGRYPFKITLNKLGEDLVSGSDTVTLVDELSDTLTMDTTSIRVVNTKTDEAVPNWKASVEGQKLKIVLPDNLPLTITYEATVNAAPGQTISISNSAHWEGYTTPTNGGSVVENKFSYSNGGTAGAEISPSVTVKKLDQYNTSQALPGAKFTLVEGSYADGKFTATANGLSLNGKTGEDGTLTFGKTSDQTMKYNTVYCLTETAAPENYVLDATPHYFAVAKQEDGSYPTFPNGVTVWYQSAVYTYQAYNHKGEATVTKAFLDAGGNSLEKIDGAYRFGIYAEANPTGNPLQTVTITYANSTVTPEGGTAKFTNLTLGDTYYIYELDDSGQPISGNAPATLNSSSFLVTYAGGPAVTIPTDGTAAAAVIVTNQVCYPELPHTGGAGTTLYTTGGVLLTASAMFLLLYYHTKRRKEDSASS